MLYSLKKLQLGSVDRDAMRAAGTFNAQVMDFIRPYVRAGITTDEIDRLIEEYTRDHGHVPAPLGYQGFPKSCCTSINDVICHGIPDDYRLQDGDIINVDITSIVDGWHGDQSETFLIGDVSREARGVTQASFDCLYMAISAIKPGGKISDIGDTIVSEARRRGYSVVQEYIGHGLGREFHQKPNIPHVPTRQSRYERIEPGVCFTIEPMINAGARHAIVDSQDGWTVRTKDSRFSAQFEHTILMTETGPEILTLTKDGPQQGFKF